MTSINTSSSTALRNALTRNMDAGHLAALKSGTGDEFIYAYQDPSGQAIYNTLNLEKGILETVATGIKQSKALINIADSASKETLCVLDKMQKIIAKAHMGYMNDKLIQDTLAPEYIQLKAELDRIADSASFAQQKLLNGTGGKIVDGTDATMSTTIDQNYDAAGVSKIGAISWTPSITATTKNNTSTDGAAITITGGTPTLVGGTFADDGSNTTVDGATLRITGAVITDDQGTTGIANITVTDIDLTIVGVAANGSDEVTGAVTVDNLDASKMSINITDRSGGLRKVTNIDDSATSGAITTIGDSTVSGVSHVTSQGGGITKKSIFEFASGTDLVNDKIQVELHSIRLSDLVRTLDVTYKSADVPTAIVTDLTDLQNKQEATDDNARIQALADTVIKLRANIGAYESRFEGLTEAMANELEQISLAIGAIGDADMPKEIENVARANVKTRTAIAMLSKMNEELENFVRLVS